ncbi:endonuclease domain-containing protein [Streptomyces gottesmaniae]|uniref:endonuclease domain-containing protein n=1 Tax=Streptomyces gottesmaniae TaxID=3075518 RepID=UPI00099C0831
MPGHYGVPLTRDTLHDCEGCGVTIKYRGEGRRGGHCLSCSRIARQGRRYNLTAGDVRAILELQGGVCALCGRGPDHDGSPSYWHIDHDHACCKPSDAAWSICGACVRGLLCSGCNARGLAWYELLPRDRRDWGRMNDYLANSPARRLRLAGMLEFCLEYLALAGAARRR